MTASGVNDGVLPDKPVHLTAVDPLTPTDEVQGQITGVWQTTGRQGRRQVENASFSTSTWNTVEDGKVLPLYQQLRYNVTVKGGINLALVTASGLPKGGTKSWTIVCAANV